jgi:ubiquitin-activating enzyme E1
MEGEEEVDHLPSRLSVHHLGPLQQLRQLSLCKRDIGGIAEELLSLPALAGLQALRLEECELEQLPRALSALTHLTSLNLSRNRKMSATTPLSTLHRLQSLDISQCGIRTVPQQLSVLTSLTRLDLRYNFRLDGGWQHLQPLNTLLQSLHLPYCGLTAIPEHVSVLTALTRLDLPHNSLERGWEHLQPLKPLLQRLNLAHCGLTAVPEHVSVLTALTRLNLYGTEALAGGWQHLQPLTRLQKLHQNTGLPAWQVPPALANLPHVQVLNDEVEELSTTHGSFVDCYALWDCAWRFFCTL